MRLRAIDACIPQLDAELDVGYERIAARCPDLARQPRAQRLGAWLPRGWNEARNDLSAGSLAELRTLVARELATPARGAPHPSVAHLNEDSRRTSGRRRSSAAASGPLSRLAAIGGRAQPRRRRSAAGSIEMIQRTGRSQTFVELLTYGSIALVVVLAGIIVFNELRAAGLIRRRARAAGDERSALRDAAQETAHGPMSSAPRHRQAATVAGAGRRKADRHASAPARGRAHRARAHPFSDSR